MLVQFHVKFGAFLVHLNPQTPSPWCCRFLRYSELDRVQFLLFPSAVSSRSWSLLTFNKSAVSRQFLVEFWGISGITLVHYLAQTSFILPAYGGPSAVGRLQPATSVLSDCQFVHEHLHKLSAKQVFMNNVYQTW